MKVFLRKGRMARVERSHLRAKLDLPDRRESSDLLECIFGLSKEPEEKGDEERHTENYYSFQTKLGAR